MDSSVREYRRRSPRGIPDSCVFIRTHRNVRSSDLNGNDGDKIRHPIIIIKIVIFVVFIKIRGSKTLKDDHKPAYHVSTAPRDEESRMWFC